MSRDLFRNPFGRDWHSVQRGDTVGISAIIAGPFGKALGPHIQAYPVRPAYPRQLWGIGLVA